MKNQIETAYSFTLDFTLRSDKQWFLLYVLHQVCGIELKTLASLVEVEINRLVAVMQGNALLSQSESLKVVHYFCLVCGD